MDETINYSAAIIFWSYIALALIFTSTAIHTIFKIPSNAKSLGKTDQALARKDVLVFSALSFISFAALSFNMLRVLIEAYQFWSAQRSLPALVFHDGSFLTAFWHWSTTSTPFADFGAAIVGDDFAYFWSQAALLETFSVCLYMGYEGPRLGVPNLWVFFALSQILPISFAQNLFYLAQVRLPKKTVTPNVTMSQLAVFGPLVVYCACLFAASYISRSPYLIPTILLARLMLVIPYFTPRTSAPKEGDENPEGSEFGLYSAQVAMESAVIAMIAKQGNALVQQEFAWGDLWNGLFSNPAVTALGVDMIWSLISYGTWLGIQRHDFSDDEEPPEDEKVH